MKDKRKVGFILICLLITIICEIFMFRNAKKEDQKYKNTMDSKLKLVSLELEARGFDNKNEKNSLRNGILEYERNEKGSDYGYLKILYDLDAEISDISIKLEYSSENYSEDIFSDVYYIFNLVGLDLYEEEYTDALNILLDDSSADKIDEKIAKSEIYINDKIYTISLKSIKENGEEKIQFCLE